MHPASAVEFSDVHVEPAPYRRGAGIQCLHRRVQPVRGSGRPEDGQRLGAARELAVEEQEQQTTEVVTVQVARQRPPRRGRGCWAFMAVKLAAPQSASVV